MTDPISEVFGYVLIASAVLLYFRERRAFRNRGADAWLITRRRLRRRTLISVVLGAVGAMIVAWGRGMIDFRDPQTGLPNPTPFTLYVLALTAFACLLVLLAFFDFTETSRNATRYALEEFSLPADKLQAGPDETPDKTES